MDYTSQFNNMIDSGDCHPIDPIYEDSIKLKIDCLSSTSIRFRYFFNFGNDQSCVQESIPHSTLKSGLTINAEDGACTQMSNGVYYKFGIAPLASTGRQMQGIPTTITTTQTNTDITTYPIADPNYGIYPSV